MISSLPYGLNFPRYTDDSQIYFSSWSYPLNSCICLLDGLSWMSNRHLKAYICTLNSWYCPLPSQLALLRVFCISAKVSFPFLMQRPQNLGVILAPPVILSKPCQLCLQNEDAHFSTLALLSSYHHFLLELLQGLRSPFFCPCLPLVCLFWESPHSDDIKIRSDHSSAQTLQWLFITNDLWIINCPSPSHFFFFSHTALLVHWS